MGIFHIELPTIIYKLFSGNVYYKNLYVYASSDILMQTLHFAGSIA